jgi:hypothetical protein
MVHRFQPLVLLGSRNHLIQRQLAPVLQRSAKSILRRIQHVGDTTGHTGSKVTASLDPEPPRYHRSCIHNRGHRPLQQRRSRLTVTHAETLATNTIEEGLRPPVAPYMTVLPQMMFCWTAPARKVTARTDDDATTGETLTHVVVTFTHQVQASRHEPGRHRSSDRQCRSDCTWMVVIRQTGITG